MSELIFTLKKQADTTLDCRNLISEKLANLSIEQIAALALGNATVGNYFDVQGDPAGNLVFNGDCSKLDYIGYGMKCGQITVNGNAGDFLGANMQGGILICKGNAGERVGDLMRRGMLLIEGNVGNYCASRIKAGTIGVLGSTGQYLGFNMKRGTILLKQVPAARSTLVDCGVHTLPFLSLLFKSFQTLDTAFNKLNSRRVQRLMGDTANGGVGEVLFFN